MADFGRTLYRANSSGAHGLVFFGRGALSAADDGAGMSHATSRWRGLTGDKADYRLFHMFLDVLRGHFFGIAANFTDHHDRVRITDLR